MNFAHFLSNIFFTEYLWTTTSTTTAPTTTTTTTTTITFTNLVKSAPMLQLTRAYISEQKILFCSKLRLKSLILLAIFGT